jgi:hypothetical protein
VSRRGCALRVEAGASLDGKTFRKGSPLGAVHIGALDGVVACPLKRVGSHGFDSDHRHEYPHGVLGQSQHWPSRRPSWISVSDTLSLSFVLSLNSDLSRNGPPSPKPGNAASRPPRTLRARRTLRILRGRRPLHFNQKTISSGIPSASPSVTDTRGRGL